MTRRLAAVILAAGKGSRMRSQLPKVLHRVAGRPMLHWVLDAARSAGCDEIVVVVGHGAGEVRSAVQADDLRFALQREQLGTGHALAQAADQVAGTATVLVLSGDVPLVQPQTLQRLAAAAENGWGAVAVAELEEPGSLGRVIATPDGGGLERIVEVADAAEDELAIRRVNAGIYALPAPQIFEALERLTPNNAKGEFYLTDALGAAARAGERVVLVPLEDPVEALGANDRRDIARIERAFSARAGLAGGTAEPQSE
jgi:bifunctional UDP-N-acetylglucosamine pyrophosphorylase/glucosamine-1-phosphate N-acetyltransferase